MNTQRLLEGAAFLENLQLAPNEQFYMGCWVDNKIWRYNDDGTSTRECGTAGCAMGWFGIRGLWGLKADTRTGDVWLGGAVDGDGERHDQWETAEHVFDINSSVAGWLFSPSEYHVRPSRSITKEMVAARMRHLAAGGTPDTWQEAA